jgi:hypothetical protein
VWLAQFPQNESKTNKKLKDESTNKKLKDKSTKKPKDLETSAPKNVTEGRRVASTCDVVISVFYAFDASSRCLSSVVMVPRAFVGSLGPPTPVKKFVAFCHARYDINIIIYLFEFQLPMCSVNPEFLNF